MDGIINYGYYLVIGIKIYYLNYNIKSEGVFILILIIYVIVECLFEFMIVYLNDNI